MAEHSKPTVIPIVSVETVLSNFEQAELGQWYWVDSEDGEKNLCCVMQIGSNFVELHPPTSSRSLHSFVRIHRNNFTDRLTFEPAADSYIRKMIAQYQAEMADNMAEIQHLTESLGIAQQASNDTNGKSLALLSDQIDVASFKNALVLAKKESLPALFKKNEEIAAELKRWMGAEAMPMRAKFEPMKLSMSNIDDRLFNIELYSGLLETILTVSEGAPAPREEKLRVMQRRLYMDEECLLSYTSGGMEFANLREFDQWLAKPENRDRILPFPRCMVSMKVRRIRKDRSDLDLSFWVRIRAEKADEFTYLIVRNGDQVYRVCTEIDFGELMFPDRAVFDPSEPMMMKVSGRDIKETMTKREFDSRVAENAAGKAASEKWKAENPKEQWEAENPNRDWYYFNPFRNRDRAFSEHGWQPFDDSSVYFDEGMKAIQKEIKGYNRIALVVQGLFDRTLTLHPHGTVQIWRPASFASAVELIYDSSMALNYGDAPDIEAYIAACNAKATADSVMFGQEMEWKIREAMRENERNDRSTRPGTFQRHRYTTLAPYGDPGPGRIALMASWKPRSKIATFTWQRERRQHYDQYVRATIAVPLDKLFNASAYTPGDFKRFFADPRTRERYLDWAPMLLSAEDYHNGRLAAREPLAESDNE